MHTSKWLFRTLLLSATVSTVCILTLRAQNFNDASELVAEEMTIEDALTADLATDDGVDALLMEAEKGLESGTDDALPPVDVPADDTAVLSTLGDDAFADFDIPTTEEASENLDAMADGLKTDAEALEDLPIAETTALDAPAADSTLELAPEENVSEALPADALGDVSMPAEELAMPAEELAMPAEELAMPAEELAMPAEELAMPAEELAMPAEELAMPAEELAMPAEELAMPAEELAMPAEELAMPAEDLAAPTGDDPFRMDDAGESPAVVESAPEMLVAEPVMEPEPVADSGIGALDVAVEKELEAVAPPVAAVPAVAAAPQNPRTRAIEVLREGEELRRRAFREHAAEKLEQADAAFAARDYTTAERYYDQAARAMEQAGGRPENRADMARARTGMLESLYSRAVEMRQQGDRENAIKLAREASVQGHPKAADLVKRIEKDMMKPVEPPKKDEPRWKQEEYLKKSETVNAALTRGREHFMANELDDAQLEFESVLNLDPHNTEAIRWREKVTQTRFDRASMELETTRQDMMTRVRETWNPRDYGAGETPAATKQTEPTVTPIDSPTQRILSKMADILIPEIDFRQANIHDVIQFLQDSSAEFDTSAEGAKGVNFILKLGGPESAAPVQGGGDFGQDEFAPAPVAPAGTELITFRAREISLLEALRIVTDVANLKFRVEGNVVMVVPFNSPDQAIVHRMYDVLPTMAERITTIRESSDTRGDFTTIGGGEVSSSQTDWKAFFQEMGVQWPIGSSIKHVPAIGKLMVANTADNLAVFEQRLAALNIVPKQIEIEARFVEVNQTDLNSLGFEWNLTDPWEIAYKKGDENLPMAQRQRIEMGAGSFTSGNRYIGDAEGITQLPQNLQGANDSLLTIASVLTNPELSFVLHALEQKGNADLLSAPKVTTQSGVEATIKVVTEYIYPSEYTIEPGESPQVSDGVITGGRPPVVTPSEFETREVGVILSVLPEVSTEGEMINLTMSPEVVTEPEWRNYGQSFTDAQGVTTVIPIEQPFFHTRSISTSILIYNGATVVMGGMITEERIQVDDKIPLLGDLPLIGRLFQSRFDNSIKKNLLIFVTARLVDPAGRQVGSSRAPGSQEMFLPGVQPTTSAVP